jgi:serine/threonine-protein kinase
MGTPDYISPEQVKGKRGDARSDLYALGVMFYEILTGQVPFSGDNAFVIMNDRLLNNPVPPREVDPAITPQLQEIIYRALERDPKNRYPNAHDFAWDLEHSVAEEDSVLCGAGADSSGDFWAAAVGREA